MPQGIHSFSDKEKFELELNTTASLSHLKESVKDDPVTCGILSVIKNWNTHRGWKSLKEKHTNKTGNAINMTALLKSEWNKTKISNDLEDPDIWLNELKRIREKVTPAIQKN